jgi:hypothetical protein
VYIINNRPQRCIFVRLVAAAAIDGDMRPLLDDAIARKAVYFYSMGVPYTPTSTCVDEENHYGIETVDQTLRL